MKEQHVSDKALDKLVDVIKHYSDLENTKLRQLVDHINVEVYKKGTVLIEQGERIDRCFFIIEGCARQFSIDEEGKEVTSEFFTENQTVSIFLTDKEMLSPYSVVCLEDSTMIIGNLDEEEEELAKYPELKSIVLKMVEEGMGNLQDTFATFIRLPPKDRVKHMMGKRPELFTRVPQHQLASYLGITPESLSRIKGRLGQDYLKLVE